MTLAGVASRVGLITTSVTYYFKKKEDLAVACFLDGIARFDELATDALRMDGPHARVQRLLEAWLDLRRRIAAGEAPAIAVFNDIRALQKPQRGVVLQAYMRFFDKIREIFVAPELAWLDAQARTARAQILTEQIFWAVAWLPRYDLEDYERIRERMYDIFVHGLAAPGRSWQPQPLSLDAVLQSSAQELTPRETFLIAATRLINEQGYRGASVEKISSRLNVTKGSFYHHHEAKDELVVDCFKRSFEVMRRVQRAVGEGDQDELVKLATAASALVDYQLSDRGPLLRTSALTALPESICLRDGGGLQPRERSLRLADLRRHRVGLGARGRSVHRGADAHRDAERLRGDPLVDPGRRPRAGAGAVREAGADRDLLEIEDVGLKPDRFASAGRWVRLQPDVVA